MSLKGGRVGRRWVGLLSGSVQEERDKPSARWECGNRNCDFQGQGETPGNLGLVFCVIHGPAFPRRSGSSGFHALLRSWRKPEKSWRLASCMYLAQLVSLCLFAI